MNISRLTLLALPVAATLVTGCYVVPIGPDGQPMYPIPPHGSTTPVPVPYGAPQAVVLTARLYPMNDVASATGVVTGSVTNMMQGKGHFQLSYRGETLTGEATRVSNDDRRGVASAYGPSGMSMSCEYQMNTPRQGAGTCTFSNGARYQVHLGS